MCSVVLNEDNDYISFVGMWYDADTRTAYLEPMVTLKQYRNLGLGKACVLHSMRMLQEFGCRKLFVEPDEDAYDYYLKLGFKKFEYTRYFEKIHG